MKLNIDTWVNQPGKKWIARVPSGASGYNSWGITDGMVFEESHYTTLSTTLTIGLDKLKVVSGEMTRGYSPHGGCASCKVEYLEEYEPSVKLMPIGVESLSISYSVAEPWLAQQPKLVIKLTDGVVIEGFVTKISNTYQ